MKVRLRHLVVAGGLALGVALAVGIAGASIPQDGVFTGCYLKSGGTLRVIDPSVTNCRSTETKITWNQQGQPGPQGPPGAAAGGALVRTEVWTPFDPGNPVLLTSTTEWVTLMTITKPAGGYWDKALVTWSLNVGNWWETPGGIVCRIPNSTSTPMLQMFDGMTPTGGFAHGVGGTLTWTTAYSSTASAIQLQCQVFPHPSNPSTYQIAVNWGTLAVAPATDLQYTEHW